MIDKWLSAYSEWDPQIQMAFSLGLVLGIFVLIVLLGVWVLSLLGSFREDKERLTKEEKEQLLIWRAEKVKRQRQALTEQQEIAQETERQAKLQQELTRKPVARLPDALPLWQPPMLSERPALDVTYEDVDDGTERGDWKFYTTVLKSKVNGVYGPAVPNTARFRVLYKDRVLAEAPQPAETDFAGRDAMVEAACEPTNVRLSPTQEGLLDELAHWIRAHISEGWKPDDVRPTTRLAGRLIVLLKGQKLPPWQYNGLAPEKETIGATDQG